MKDEDLRYNQISEWMSRYGVLERITRYNPEDNTCSRGKKGSSSLRRRPGISPMVFSNHLMSKCVFLHLSDISLDLPPISEQAVIVSMSEELEYAYKKIENELVSAVRQALAKGSKSLLGTYLNTLLSYPDRPFDNKVIIDPLDGSVIAIPIELPKDRIYPKEKQLIELLKTERKQRRKVFVFCQYTNTKDITQRLKEILMDEGIKTEVLRSTVKPESREEWIQDKVDQGVEVLIANPKLVETGLDLYAFPTLIFFQTGYSIFTLRQASRRSWRIGQDKEVRVYYLFYASTMQERALQLIGSKLEASLAIEGKFSEEGLLAMTSGEDMTTAMAKALTEGLEVEGAEQIWRKINKANPQTTIIQTKTDVIDEEDEPEPKAKPVKRPEVVYVDFISYVGRRKKKVERMALKPEEMAAVMAENKAACAQLSLFS